MWTIHSVGGSAFLEQVLIAVSMIFGTGDFVWMASIGLLIGVLIIFFQSVMTVVKKTQGSEGIEAHCAFDEVYTVLEEIFRAVSLAVDQSDSSLVKVSEKVISNSHHQVRNDFAVL